MNPVDLIPSIQSNTPLIHKLYSKVNELQKTLNEAIPVSPIQKDEQKIVLSQFEKWKLFGLSDIYLATDLLNPAAQGCKLTPEELLEY